MKEKYNTIDTEVFKTTPSNFKQEHNLQDKNMILGLSNVWNDRKGLNDFIELSAKLDSDKYQIVLIGLNDKQLKEIKKRISIFLDYIG